LHLHPFRSLMFLLTLLPLLPSAASAKPDHVVNSANDPGNGTCDAAECTLREAADEVSAGNGKSIGCDPTAFPPGSGTQILLGAALVITVPNGFALDCAGGSMRVWQEDIELESGLGNSLAGVSVRDITVAQDLVICAGQIGNCDQALSKVKVERVAAKNVDLYGASISGCSIRDSSADEDLSARADPGPLSGVSLFGNRAGGIEVHANVTDATKVKIGGNTAREGIEVRASNAKVQDVVVADNIVSRAGISVDSSKAAKISIRRNQVTDLDADEDGISLSAFPDGAEKIRIESNAVSGARDLASSDEGIVLEAQTLKSAKISKNRVSGREDDGIQVSIDGATSGLQVTGNISTDNTATGISIRVGPGSKKTKVQKNVANDGERGTGIELTGGPFDVSKNRTLGNGRAGIDASGARDSSFKGNIALGNDVDDDVLVYYDLVDDNGCSTNQWKGNRFRTSDDPCIR
jgi:nitrous oxidase accessory protein NosD